MAIASVLRRAASASAPASLVNRAIRSQKYHNGSALLSAVVNRSGLSRQASRSLFPLARHYSSLPSSEEFDDQAEGWNVVLEQSYGASKVTKDGVKGIEFKDRVKSRRYSTTAEPIGSLIALDVERVRLASIMKTGVLYIAAVHDGTWRKGTAFFIDADGTFISCAHVPCERVPGKGGEPDKFRVGKVVVMEVGGKFVQVSAEILAIDTLRDMFIGRIHREYVGKSHIFEFSDHPLPPGATVYGMGHAFNFAYAFRIGVMSDPLRRVMNFDTDHKERILLNPDNCPYEFFLSELDLRFGRGCSGGPLINNWLKVVGILQSGTDGLTAMAIQSKHAIDFIKSWRCGSYDSLMINGEEIDF